MIEEIERIKAKNTELESNNRILIDRLSRKNKELVTLSNLCSKEKEKLRNILSIVTSGKINEENYKKTISWIKDIASGDRI